VSVLLGEDPEAIVPAEGRAYELGRKLVRAIENKETYPEQEKYHAEMFDRMRALVMANKGRWHHEYEHWRAAGWISE
ncbi:MAG: iron-sulfur protein, partial [Methanomicrobiales archaeon]|nr:iron-sulfur protein [Methanomicrobiales archaeon]